MKRSYSKNAPVRLDGDAYDDLRLEVLRRDHWRCQLCGAMTNLEIHHQQFRGHSGDDTQENLITLCAGCHKELHR